MPAIIASFVGSYALPALSRLQSVKFNRRCRFRAVLCYLVQCLVAVVGSVVLSVGGALHELDSACSFGRPKKKKTVGAKLCTPDQLKTSDVSVVPSSWRASSILSQGGRRRLLIPAGSPSRGGDVTVDVFDINQPSLLALFILFSCLFRSFWPFQLYFIP